LNFDPSVIKPVASRYSDWAIMKMMMMIKFFIYLRAEFSSQWPITQHEYSCKQQQQYYNTGQKQ
jgi:hypothetical protein